MSNDSSRVPSQPTEEERQAVRPATGQDAAANGQEPEEGAEQSLGVEELEQRIAPVQIV